MTYAASRAMAEGLVGKVLFAIMLLGLVVIWFAPIKDKLAPLWGGRRRNLK